MLEEKGWSQDQLALITGHRRQTIGAIVTGKAGITADMAVALAAAFGNAPGDWLKWDADYQLSLVETDSGAVERRARIYASAPIRDMQKRGWIKDTADLDELEASLAAFFGAPISEGISFPVAARRTIRLDSLNSAEKAWCFRARQMAAALLVAKKFDPDQIPRLEKKLRQIAAYPKEVQRLPKTLAEYGVRFVVVEPLPNAKIDGAAFWIGEEPVIAVSARWDRVDAFWFTVMHEWVHIKNGDASADTNLLREPERGVVSVALAEDDAERRANEEAASILVPQDELESFIRRLSPLYSSQRIVQFAVKVQMHPGIIVGQLQHRGELGYSAHRDFLLKIRGAIAETAMTDGWGQSIGPRIV